MSICPNCKTTLSCGCQIRTASNGARVCATCITSYENMLAQIKTATNQIKKP
jgi:hypothetical protein